MDFFTNYHEYHIKVIDTLKTALYKKDNKIFDKIDFYDDSVYEEPLLYACINNPNFNFWIDSLILGLSDKKDKLDALNVSVFNGTIYIPSIGYYHFKNLDDTIIQVSVENNDFIFKLNGAILSYTFRKIIRINEHIELLECNHPLLARLFLNEKGGITGVIINAEECYKQEYLDNFNKAFFKIEAIYNQYYELINKYIKKVVFYKGEPNSFATIQAHGIVFFNIDHGNSEVFFLDNILHQCAHVFFNTLTFDKAKLFTIPHNSDLCFFTGNRNDKGFILYDRYHGLFTQTNINKCFDKCLEQNLYSGDSYLEFVAKFTSNMNRFATAVKKFDRKEKYKKQGLQWFCFFKNTFETIYFKNKELLSLYNVSNQPYVFDFEIFKKTNNSFIDPKKLS